jgi:hypothetical protein
MKEAHDTGWARAGERERQIRLDQLLSQFYVPRDLVQPTRFGNALVAGGQRVQNRWGLDPMAVWPRVHALLTPEQQQLEADARTDLAFLINASAGAAIISVAAAGNWLAGGSWNGRGVGIIVSAVVAAVFYRFAADAATKWVADVQGSFIDVTRKDLFERLGVARADSHDDELRRGQELSVFLLRGHASGDLLVPEQLAPSSPTSRPTTRDDTGPPSRFKPGERAAQPD